MYSVLIHKEAQTQTRTDGPKHKTHGPTHKDERALRDRSDTMTCHCMETMDGRTSQDRSIPSTGIVPVPVLYILTYGGNVPPVLGM